MISSLNFLDDSLDLAVFLIFSQMSQSTVQVFEMFSNAPDATNEVLETICDLYMCAIMMNSVEGLSHFEIAGSSH